MKTYWLTISCVVALVLVLAAVIGVKFFSSGTEEPVAQVIAESQSGAIETRKGQALRPHAEGSRSLAGAELSESVELTEPNEGPKLADTASVDDVDGRVRKGKAQKARKTYPSRSLLSSDSSESERARQLLENPPQFGQRQFDPADKRMVLQPPGDAASSEASMELLAELRAGHTRQHPAEAEATAAQSSDSRQSDKRLMELLHELRVRRERHKHPLYRNITSPGSRTSQTNKVMELMRKRYQQQDSATEKETPFEQNESKQPSSKPRNGSATETKPKERE